MAVSLPTIGAKARDVFVAVLPSAVAAGIMAGIVFLVSPYIATLPAPARLAILVCVGAAVYLGISWRFQRHTIEDLVGVWLKKKRPV